MQPDSSDGERVGCEASLSDPASPRNLMTSVYTAIFKCGMIEMTVSCRERSASALGKSLIRTSGPDH
jgi:hypothetical protein